jgi:hypothetical protein
MQAVSARRIETDEKATEVAATERTEVEEEEVDVFSPDDASEVTQELK